ncbi:MAG TPA: hypothetical protein GXX75_06575 [Clostridiales bacterium]|nr:hypothetical protein [Clostridiales bacterium]
MSVYSLLIGMLYNSAVIRSNTGHGNGNGLASGVLAKSTRIDGYEVDENGVRKTK